MHKAVLLLSAILVCATVPLCAFAQTLNEPVPSAAIARPVKVVAAALTAVATPICADCLLVPALTPVKIEIRAVVGSKLSKSGDPFAIRLAEPIVVDGKVIVPAGVSGMAEIIHAKKAGGSGAPGELVLAARYLDVGGQRVRLRSMHLALTGKSRIGTGHTLALGGAAAGAPGSAVLGMVGFLLKGGEMTLPEGTMAEAKTAEDTPLRLRDPAVTAAPAPAATPQPAVLMQAASTRPLIAQPVSQEGK